MTGPHRAEREATATPPPRVAAYLRCRILARIRRFLRPILRRPLPVFFTPIRQPTPGALRCLEALCEIDDDPADCQAKSTSVKPPVDGCNAAVAATLEPLCRHPHNSHAVINDESHVMINDEHRHPADDADYICPTCGEQIVVPIDLTAGRQQSYIEDCPVCCAPNLLRVAVDRDGGVQVDVSSA